MCRLWTKSSLISWEMRKTSKENGLTKLNFCPKLRCAVRGSWPSKKWAYSAIPSNLKKLVEIKINLGIPRDPGDMLVYVFLSKIVIRHRYIYNFIRFSITVSTWMTCIKSEKATSYNLFTRSTCPSHTLQNKFPQ